MGRVDRERTFSVKNKCMNTIGFAIFSYSSSSSYLGRGTSYRMRMSLSNLLIQAGNLKRTEEEYAAVIDNRELSIFSPPLVILTQMASIIIQFLPLSR